MKFITSIPSSGYSEVSQKSPMRWALLKTTNDYTDWGDPMLEGQHGWWKCKDFLNDVVIYRRLGKAFGIYGFHNKVVEPNTADFALAVKNVPDYFTDNLQSLNEWLRARKFPTIDHQKIEPKINCDAEVILFVPTYYFDNTFFISVITSLIRSCVYVKGTFEQCIAEEPTLNGYWDGVNKFFVPSNKNKCDELVFSNFQYNAKNIPTSSYLMHDAGLQSWIDSEVF